MAGETVVTILGNLTSDPEVRQAGGVSVASFTIASTPRQFDKAANEHIDGPTLFMNCSVWRDMADNVGASLAKGTRVVATGRIRQRSYDTKPTDGSAPVTRTVIELEVDEIGPSLRYARASLQRSQSSRTQADHKAAAAAPPARREYTPNPDEETPF